MTATSVSPAPDPTLNGTSLDYDEDDDAARETEEFLAGLMHASYAEEDGGYLPTDNVPVRAYANMLSSDDVWIMSTDKSGKEVVPVLPGMGRGERIAISLPVIPAVAQDTFWEMEHAKLQDDRDEFADAYTSPEDMNAQFLLWEKLRMNAFLAKRKRDQETKMAPAQQS